MTTTTETYTAEEMKEDAKERIKRSEESVASYTYPVDSIWSGTERETVVTMTISAEMTTEYDPFEEKHVTTGARAFFEVPPHTRR